MRLEDLKENKKDYSKLSNNAVNLLSKIEYFAGNLHGLTKKDRDMFSEHQWKNIKDLVNQFDKELRKI